MSPLDLAHDHEPGPETLPPRTPHETRTARALRWVDDHARVLLSLAVVFQVAVLLATVGLAVRPLIASDSRTVLLQAIPVDPRDLFRGDYVILSYREARTPAAFDPGQTVYVALEPEPDGRHYRGAGASPTPPAGGGVFLRGTVGQFGRIEFGLEKFFLPEGQGHMYEGPLREQRVWAEVVVAADGQARLNRLVIE